MDVQKVADLERRVARLEHLVKSLRNEKKNDQIRANPDRSSTGFDQYSPSPPKGFR